MNLFDKIRRATNAQGRLREQAVAKARQEKALLRDVYRKLPPEAQAAFRTQLGGRMGEILDEAD